MDLQNNISFIDICDNRVVVEYLKDMDYKIYHMDGCRLLSMDDVFNWIRSELPLDPPLLNKINFDALTDSLWGGFDNLGEEKVAILWYNPTSLMTHDKIKFDILLDCFKELSDTLFIEEYGVNKPITLKIILFDKGALYFRFKDRLY